MLSERASSRLRVLHIVGESRFGGAAKIILGLGHVARNEGWHADILTTDPIFQQALTQHGLGLVDLDVIRREIRPFWDLAGLVRLHGFLRKGTYDIVHTHTSKGGFIGRLAAKLAGVPMILHTAHGFAFHEASPGRTRRFYSSLERIASHWCDRVITVSEFHRNWALELGMCSADKIVAIPNGIADPGRHSNVDFSQLRRQLQKRNGDFLILSVGRLAPDKGLEYLIEAAAAMPQMERRLQIVIAGDGPAREQLERFAVKLGVTDRVSFIGFREDVADLLAACDLVALPSVREGLSIALLEAMAAGKPIVATSIGSQREVALHAEVGLFVRPADAISLAEAILRLAGDQALMTRLGNNARTVYENFYTEDRMLRSYRRMYLDMLEEKRSQAAEIESRRNRGFLEGRPEVVSNIHPTLVSSHQLKGLRV